MNDNSGWFHCGRCGRFFQSRIGGVPQLCENCGHSPVVKAAARVAFDPVPSTSALPARSRKSTEERDVSSARRRSGKARRHQAIVLKICGGALLGLIALVMGAKFIWKDDELLRDRSENSQSLVGGVSEADEALLQNATPLCTGTLSNYLIAETPEARSQFVYKAVETVPRMIRYYQLNSTVAIDPRELSLLSREVLDVGGEKGIAMRLITSRALKVEAFFLREGSDWKLDWKHFVRFSDYPWPMFLAGQGPDRGEFRLWARRRLSEEKGGSSSLSFMLYEPRFGKPQEIGVGSPELVVERDSEAGTLLSAGFRNLALGIAPFGEKAPHEDPDGLLRVRVIIRRITDEKGRRFELEKVAACHWMDVQNPGVAPLTAAEAAVKEEVTR